MLLQELCIGDLPSFIAMIENDPDDVLEKLRSDSCSCLSNDGRCSDVNDEELRDAGCELHCCCVRAGYQGACGAARAEGWQCVWQGPTSALNGTRSPFCRREVSSSEDRQLSQQMVAHLAFLPETFFRPVLSEEFSAVPEVFSAGWCLRNSRPDWPKHHPHQKRPPFVHFGYA